MTWSSLEGPTGTWTEIDTDIPVSASSISVSHITGITGFFTSALTTATFSVTSNVTITGTVTAASVFKGPDGAVSAPTYTFTSDTNTGIYGSGSDSLFITVGGANKQEVWSGGHIMKGVVTVETELSPEANDGAKLGSSLRGWSDLYLARGSVIDWNAGDITLSHSTNTLTLAGGNLELSGTQLKIPSTGLINWSGGATIEGASGSLTVACSQILMSGPLMPVTNDAHALGSTNTKWSDLFLASGSVINFNSGDVTITHAANELTIAGGLLIQGDDLRIDGSLDHNGANVGFYGTAPVAKQTGVAVTAAAIHAALVNLGLIGS